MSTLARRPARTFLSSVSLAVILAVLLVATVFSSAASAAPVLSVVKTGGKALLGADATIRIVVTNTGDERGFNLSLSDTFTSVPLRGDGKNKTVEFVSASTSDGALTPTSVTTDPVTNALTVQFDDIRDLVPTEAIAIDITVRPSDPTWAVGDVIHDEAEAQVNTRADGGGTWIEGSATGDTEIIPIKVLTKSANQSTGVDQATGCGEVILGSWPYTYTLTVQNNYVNVTNTVVVTDTIPDGIEYLGMAAGPAPDVISRDNATGRTTLTWNIGDMAASQTWTVQYGTGIRYDYFGTNNGGTNRAYDNYSGTPPVGTPIPNKTALPNTADLTATYLGTPVTDSDDASVTAAYLTIAKGNAPSTVVNGSSVGFTVTYTASEYYTGSNIVVTDILPDGLTYAPGSSSPAPDSVQEDTPGPGQTTLTWNTLPVLPPGQQETITFGATVDNTWSAPPDADHTWIVAGDRLTNNVLLDADWADMVQPGRTGTLATASASSVAVLGPNPTIIKEAALDSGGSPGAYSHSVSATVGDTVWFRVRVNTADGANPTTSNLQFGNIDVIDWIPQGTSYVASSAAMTYSDAGDFHYSPPTVKFTAHYDSEPQAVSSGSLQGEAWSLGNISAGGWWQVEFKVVVQDAAAVTKGAVVYDYGKLSGENSFGQQYSQRDVAGITYTEPTLTAAKAVTSTPSPLGAGSTVGYRITLTNTGTAAARNVLVTDTLPNGMRTYDPTTGVVTVTRGVTTLVEGTDYELSYTPATGVFLIDFDNGTTINTEIPPPPSADSVVTIDYTSQVDSNTGAGASLTNSAGTTYSAQKSGSSPNRNYGPVVATANVTLASLDISKAIVTSDHVPIGDGAGSEVTYRLTVTVPAGQVANYGTSNRLQDIVDQGAGMKYVTGSTLLSDVSGTPLTPARFTGGSTTLDPTVSRVAPPTPSYTMTWNMDNNIDNSGMAASYVFQVEFKMLANGLIDPGGSASSPSNWYFWPNTGGNPTNDSNRVRDRANIRWNNKVTTATDYSAYLYTYLQQPYLQLTKTNNKEGPPVIPVRAGETVRYTISILNNAQTTSYDNLVVDTLPAGMRTATPTTVTVTLNGVGLVEGTDYSRSYNAGSGQLTYDFEGGSTPTNIPVDQTLVITYDALVDGDVGSGATLTNTAYVEYYSEDGASGRHVRNGDDSNNANRDSSSVQTPTASMTKTIVGPNPAHIGQVVDYQLQISVPEGTDLYGPDIVDVLNANGIEYLAGSSSLADISGNPTTPASFSGGSDPSVNYSTPNPGATFTWTLNDVKNTGPGVSGDYVFRLSFQCTVTGLITPVSGGGSATDQNNWNWWWKTGGNPTVTNTAGDTGTVNWNDGSQDRSASSTLQTQNVQQPNIELVKTNDAAGPVQGGSSVGYTVTMTNNGTSTAYENVMEDVLDGGMRDVDPSGSVAATLNGVPLTPGVGFTTDWDSGNGKLTVDFTDGSGGPTVVPAGQVLVVTYSATVDDDIGAGATLTNIASVAFSSDTGASGREVPTNMTVSEHNTDDSSVSVPLSTVTKSHNAAGNNDNIGQPYTYTIDVTVPAHSTVYNTELTDTIPDGLTVDGNATFLDGSPQAIGTVNVTPQGDGTTDIDWNIGDWTNSTGSVQVLSLTLDVHVDQLFYDFSPVRGLPPQSTFPNTADLGWDDANAGGTHHADADAAPTVSATEPHLVLTNVNDAAGPVVGNQAVHYTIEATNTGTGTSYKNDLVATFPAGMRGNTPVVTNVTLGGVPLVENTDYWVTWTSGSGELRIDLDHGTSETNILTGAGNKLVVSVTASASQDAGAGATLTTLASIGYNSWSGSNGRQTDRTTDPADANTKASDITLQEASAVKTQNAAGNITTIGHSFAYTVTATVPAHTTIYDAEATDTIPDGLTVTGTTPSTGTADAVQNPLDGSWDVTWTIGDYTNTTDNPQDLTLQIAVRVDRQYFGGADVQAGDVFSNSVALDWDDAESGGSHHQDIANATNVTVREPDLDVTKTRDDPTPAAGGHVNWTIQVTNNGLWPAYDVTVNDTVDASFTYDAGTIFGPGASAADPVNLTWYVQDAHGPITPGETVTLGFSVTVDGGVTQGQVIQNTATIPSYNGDQPAQYGRTYGPASDTSSVTTRAPSLGVAKVVTLNPNPDWGELVTYQVTVTNNGDADASSVSVRDTMPAPYFSYVNGSTSITWPSGSSTADPTGTDPTRTWAPGATLAPTEQLVLSFQMYVETWAAFGTKTNIAFGMGKDGAGTDLPEHSGTADINVKQHPAIAVSKVLNDPDAYVPVGDEFSYTVTVTNMGNTTIPAVPMEDTYDQTYMEFLSATITPTDPTPGSLGWADISEGAGLDPTESASVTITLRALQAGSTPNTDNLAEVDTTDSEGNPVSGEETSAALIITEPGITVSKTLSDTDGFVPIGSDFSYIIRVENKGDTVIASPVRLTDTFDPAYMTFVSASQPPTTAGGGTLTWDDISGGLGIPLSGWIDVTVTFRAVKTGTTPQTDDRADSSAFDVHGAPVAGQEVNTALTITDPKIAVQKSLGPKQPTYVKVGEEVTFQLTVSNPGDTKVMAPVAMQDAYNKAYLSFVRASTAPDSSADDGRLNWSDVSGGAGFRPGQYKVINVVFKALKEGTAPNTTDTMTVPTLIDEHGDPVAGGTSSAHVNIGAEKVLGSTDWFVAEGSTGGGFDTWILLQNPLKDPTEAQVTFTTHAGPREPIKIAIPGESRYTIRVNDFVPDDFHVSTIVKSDSAIVVERSMYWDKRFWGASNIAGDPQPYEMRAGHANGGTPMDSVALAQPDARKTMYFPEGSTAPGFDTWILLCNPGNTAANVRLQLMTPTGAFDGGSVVVDPLSRQTVHLNLVLPNAEQVSTQVISDQPIVAERSTYWDPNAQALQPYQMKGGHASPGSYKTAKEWYLAEGSTAFGFETYVLVQNPGNSAASVKATFMTAKGIAAEKTIAMAPNSRATFKVSEFVDGDFHVATKVTSDQLVVAERSMYWDKRMTSSVPLMTEGHSATGVTVTGKKWMVPEGSTGGGFDSWVLISNPTAADTDATVTFMTASGPAQPITIEVPANTRFTMRVSDYVPDDFHVSTLVETEGQIVVERAMYWDRRVRSGIQPYEMMGGHSTTGVDP